MLYAGATVAGTPPRSETVRSLLWEDATLDLGTVDRIKGLEVIAHAVRDWTPRRAARNYLRSLEVSDWRWRFEKLASTLKVHSPRLDSELVLLRRTINELRFHFEALLEIARFGATRLEVIVGCIVQEDSLGSYR